MRWKYILQPPSQMENRWNDVSGELVTPNSKCFNPKSTVILKNTAIMSFLGDKLDKELHVLQVNCMIRMNRDKSKPVNKGQI